WGCCACRGTVRTDPARRAYLRVADRRYQHGGHRSEYRDGELSHPRRIARTARPERLLASAPVACRQYQQNQGERPLVQSELHPEDEGREGDRDTGQPVPDQAASRLSEALAEAIPGSADGGRPRVLDLGGDEGVRVAEPPLQLSLQG